MNAPTVSLLATDTFERSLRMLLPALRGYARRLTRDPTQSEDLVQETLLRAWAARHRFIPDSNLKAWLFRIEYNCFVSFLRKSRRVVQLSPEMEEIVLPAPAMQEEGLMMRDLALALAALPKSQAAALSLISDDEICYFAAAERLGVSVGTVKSRVSRGRATLRKFLAGDSDPSAGTAILAAEISGVPETPRIEAATELAPPAIKNGRYEAWKASGQRLIG